LSIGFRYLKAITGKDITAKDFRTWAGTVLAAMALSELESFDSAAQAKRNLRSAIEKVSGRLGNTPTICRKCYIHPEVLNSYMDGNLVLEIKSQAESELRSAVENLKPEEAAVLALLRGRLAKVAEQPENADPNVLSGKRTRSTTTGHVPCRRSRARHVPLPSDDACKAFRSRTPAVFPPQAADSASEENARPPLIAVVPKAAEHVRSR
jgi:DNA topoisomerase I